MPLIVRITSPKGTKRVNTDEQEAISKFYDKVGVTFGLKAGDDWYLSKERNGGPSTKIHVTRGKAIKTLDLKNGDQLYILGKAASANNQSEDLARGSDIACSSSSAMEVGESVDTFLSANSQPQVAEDNIDQMLDKKDGRIHRSMNPQLCRHNPGSKCLHCIPVEPYDEKYLESCEPPIKFLSFHAYLRRLQDEARNGTGKFVNLMDIDCKLKLGCKEHAPWPEGICMKCAPPSVTLSMQKFRHVDHVEFENKVMCEKFLDYWRNTGKQRIGYLYGRYEEHENVPLGIKAKVCAIYEPPQICTKDSVKLVEVQEDGAEGAVNRVARGLGLERIGWIFTDLTPLNVETGTVAHYRGTSETYFLSAQECITAAHFQNVHPNRCRFSQRGVYGSKFVTVVVTGDAEHNIHFESYQVSNQAMALVRDGILVPTKDEPGLGYIRESSNTQFVPEVFYSGKDKYGNEVTHLGRPLPVDYLLTHMPCSFPLHGEYTFCLPPTSPTHFAFPIEHRQDTGELQEFALFARYLKSYQGNDFLASMSNFHVLLFLASCDVFPLADKLEDLLRAVKCKDRTAANDFAASDEWQTVMRLMEHADDMMLPLTPGARTHRGGASAMLQWSCPRCTLVNQPSATNCAVCGYEVDT